MKDDIECHIPEDSLNIDKIDKYEKFIEFVRYIDEKHKNPDLIEYKKTFFYFHSEKLNKNKLTEEERFLAMEKMQENLDKCIEEELKKDNKLQARIEKIQEKSKQRINKLKEKPTKKLREKYHYKYMEEYFKPERFTQDSLEEFSTS
jgi:hypothetical protein